MPFKEPFNSRVLNKYYFFLDYLNSTDCKALKKAFVKNRNKIIEKQKNTLSSKCQSKVCRKKTASNDRLAVYTCIFGNYDAIYEPRYISPNCDYYIITDADIPQNSAWQKISPPKPEGFDDWHPAVKNRYYKMHPDVAFPNYKYSLYVDGNIVLLTDVAFFVDMLNGKPIGLFSFSKKLDIYSNAEFLKEIGFVDKDLSDKQMKAYSDEGFPENYGYFECCFILREHNNPLCRSVMNVWWNEYNTYVKRDQQSFCYALWKNGLKPSDVCTLGLDFRNLPRFFSVDHSKKRIIVK